MLRLLPPICRDCGKSGEKAALSRYLDFHMCKPCIAKREKKLMESNRPPARSGDEPAKKGSAKKGAKKPGASKRRRP